MKNLPVSSLTFARSCEASLIPAKPSLLWRKPVTRRRHGQCRSKHVPDHDMNLLDTGAQPLSSAIRLTHPFGGACAATGKLPYPAYMHVWGLQECGLADPGRQRSMPQGQPMFRGVELGVCNKECCR